MTSESVAVQSAAAAGMRIVGHCSLAGNGDAMHVAFYDHYAYVGHMGYSRAAGTSIVDIADPRNPRLVGEIDRPRGTRSHKTEVVDDLLLVNCERNPFEPTPKEWTSGIRIFDLGHDPTEPREVGFLNIRGIGVHRMTCIERPFVYMSAFLDGFSNYILAIADISDPRAPELVSTWWLPGMHTAAGEILPEWANGLSVRHHHVLPDGDRAYCAWWDGGVVALDIADKATPKLAWQWRPDGARHVHTAMPIPSRDLLVVTEEVDEHTRPGHRHNVWMLDISDADAPETISTLPYPDGDASSTPGRFGPHNVHEVRPQTGTLADDQRIFVTYFAGGLRVYDISDAAAPRETAYCVPSPPKGQAVTQLNDLAVREDGLVYVTDRVGGGLYVIEQL